jgi:hypothetical protein
MATANRRRNYGLMTVWSALVLLLLASVFRDQPVSVRGHVDELGIYNRALTPQEVEARRLAPRLK